MVITEACQRPDLARSRRGVLEEKRERQNPTKLGAPPSFGLGSLTRPRFVPSLIPAMAFTRYLLALPVLLDIVFLAVVLNNDKFCFSLLDNASVCIVLPPPPSLPPSLPPAPPLPLSPPAAPPTPPNISQEVIALLVDHLPSVSAYPGLMRWLVFAAAALFFLWFVASDGLSALVSWLTELHRVVGTDSWASAPEWRLFTLLILTLVENLATIRYLDERFDPVYPFLAFNAQAMVASATQVQRIGTMLSNSQAQAHASAHPRK